MTSESDKTADGKGLYKQYRRSQIAELADWYPGFDMAGVSISDADKAAGSPKSGDKIARNPVNHADRWLVAADYFAANFESATPAAAPEQDGQCLWPECLCDARDWCPKSASPLPERTKPAGGGELVYRLLHIASGEDLYEHKEYQDAIREAARALAGAQAECTRLNAWADSFTDAHLKERQTGDAVVKEALQRADQAEAALAKRDKDAERFIYLQSIPREEAQAFFWNHSSRTERRKAIDKARKEAMLAAKPEQASK